MYDQNNYYGFGYWPIISADTVTDTETTNFRFTYGQPCTIENFAAASITHCPIFSIFAQNYKIMFSLVTGLVTGLVKVLVTGLVIGLVIGSVIGSVLILIAMLENSNILRFGFGWRGYGTNTDTEIRHRFRLSALSLKKV